MRREETVDAIMDVVGTYVAAMIAADRVGLERVSFDRASEVGHYEGELLWNSRDAMIRMCEEAANPAAIANWALRSLSVLGDIAVVHVEDDWAACTLTTS